MITTLTINTYEGVHEHNLDACIYNSLHCAWQNITIPEPYQAGARTNADRGYFISAEGDGHPYGTHHERGLNRTVHLNRSPTMDY